MHVNTHSHCHCGVGAVHTCLSTEPPNEGCDYLLGLRKVSDLPTTHFLHVAFGLSSFSKRKAESTGFIPSHLLHKSRN